MTQPITYASSGVDIEAGDRAVELMRESVARTHIAAKAAGVVTQVGFNYLCNPMIGLAKEIVDSGELGEITGFRGIHAEGFMADPATPYNWRCQPEQAGGALADIGSHIIALARYLAGPIDRVCGETMVGANCLRAVTTWHRLRPHSPLSRRRRATSATACWPRTDWSRASR